MYKYNSFINFKNSKLNENQLKTDQEEAVGQAIEDGRIIVGNKIHYAPGGSWGWNEASGGVNFDTKVTINPDFPIKSLTELGFTFGHIKGDFICEGLEIVNLEGSPKSCFDFIMKDSDVRSLKGSPYKVANFDAQNGLIRSLEGAPRFVFGDFNLTNNMITDLSGGPFLISGSIGLLGNGFLNLMQKDPSTYSKVKLFSEMHKFIMREYMNLNLDRAIKDLEKDFESNEYFAKIILENVDYLQFIKDYESYDLAEGILKLDPPSSLLSNIKNNLPSVWKEILNIRGENIEGYETSADLGDLGF